MRRLRVAVLLSTLVIVTGCDSGRLDRLEKENANLKAQVTKDNAARDFDLKAKCSKDARVWFNQNWGSEKDTIFLDFSNHYNAQNNKCFILVEYHRNSFAPRNGTAWTNDMILTDVYENAKYAEFVETHSTFFEPAMRTADEVITCDVQGDKCKTGDEFNNLLRPYMTN